MERKFWKLALILAGVKLLISGFFTSPYYYGVYVPFLESFNLNGYDAWIANYSSYPYPPLLTFIIFIFFKLSSLFDSTYVQNLIYHIPIALFDIGVFYYLIRLIPKYTKQVNIYYLFSPIILYISYIFSQHDIIPTFFILSASFYVAKKRFNKGFWILGLAIAVKWHTIMALPVFLIYGFRKHLTYKELIKFSSFSIIPFIITLLPFGSIESALSLFKVSESNLVYESYFNVKDLSVYLFPLAYSLLLVWAFRIKRYNSELFIGINAILFLSFIIVIYPNPGWFAWSLPFMIYSFSRYETRKKELYTLYGLLSFVYLVFFIFLYKHPISDIASLNLLGEDISFYINNSRLTNIVFTLMVSLLMISTYMVYLSSITNTLLFKRKFHAFLIAIAGDSGSGKSTLLKSLYKIFGSSSTTTLEGDGEHKWERGDANWSQTTHLNPKANFLHQQLSHLINLKKGIVTERSDYNHETGKFDKAREIQPKDFVIIAGLHPFYLKGARENIDFKIFLNTEDNLRKNWKVTRDIEERGHSEEKVIKQMQDRAEDSQKYIQPQMDFADLIINYFPQKEITSYSDKIDINDISVEYLIDTDIDLDKLIKILNIAGCTKISHEYQDDLTRQSLNINFNEINLQIIVSEFEDFFENIELNSPEWENDYKIVNQIVIMYCIKHKFMENKYV
jgi:uridine kinase